MTTTLPTSVPPAATATPPRRRVGPAYARLWRLAPRQLGYLAVTCVTSGFLFAFGSHIAGGAGVLAFGLLLLVIGATFGRPLAALERLRLRWARTPSITPPLHRRTRSGVLGALGDAIADPHTWLFAVQAVLFPLLGILTTLVAGLWTLAAVGGATFPLWGQIVPDPAGGRYAAVGTLQGGGVLNARGSSLLNLAHWILTGRVDSTGKVLLVVGVTAVGFLLLAVLPFVLRGAVLAHWGLARLLLSRLPSELQRERAEAATSAQRAAIAAEDHALRRLERDIHDGPQQRLLRLQMELALAERRITDDPAAATDAVGAARALAAETLDELRALAQGFAPPLLQDRGLAAALEALGRRSAIPITTRVELHRPVPEAVERSVYFVAAELTSNALKHAAARAITLTATTDDGGLVVVVTDDGIGGAATVAGHGLAGAQERLAGLGGGLTVVSPAGGPTTATARVPLP